MRHLRSRFTIAALLGAGVCCLVARSPGAGEPPVTAHRPVDAGRPIAGATPAQSAELAELREEVVRLRRQAPAPGHEAGAGSTEAQARAPANRARGIDPDARADRERKYRGYIAGVDAAFRNEVTDPRWSSVTSSAVHAVLAAATDLGVAGHGVECRSRTCRVEISDDGTGKLGRQLPLIIQQLGRELPGVVADRVERGGVATMVLYMDRGDDAPAMAR